MNQKVTKVGVANEPTDSFAGDGEAGARMYALDWAAPPVGRGASESERKRNLSLSVLTITFVVGIFIADYITPADVILSFLYSMALLPAFGTRSRRWLWGVAVVSLVLTLVASIYGTPGAQGGHIWVAWSNRSLAMLSLFCLCTVLDRHMASLGKREQAEARAHEDRETIDRQLSEIEALYRTAPVGLTTFDSRLRCIRINEMMADISGVSIAASLGRHLREYIPGALCDVAEPLVRRVLNTGESLIGVEATAAATAGGQRQWLVNCHPWRSGGDIIGVSVAVQDVTEQSHAREALRASEERLKLALQRQGEAHASLRDLQSILDTAVSSHSSETLSRALLGRLRAVLHSDSAAILLADSDGQYLTPIAADGMEAEVSGEIRIPIGRDLAGRIAVSGGPMTFDDLTKTELVCPILRSRVRSLVGTPLKSGGRLVGVVLAGSSTRRAFTDADIRLLSLAADRIAAAVERTRLHEGEQGARRAAEMAAQQLRLALTAGKAGTFDWDAQGDISRWSDQLLELYGIRREEFGRSTNDWLEALFPEDRERAVAARERSLKTGQFEVDFRIVRRDTGAVRWIHSAGQVVFEGGKPDRMVGINVDITEQKHVEAALAARTEELRQTFDGTATGLTRCSRDLRYLAANPAYARIAGVPLQHIIGHPIVEVMGAEALETIRPYVDRVLSGESVEYDSFVPFSVSGPRLLHVAYTPSREPDGSVSGWIASVTDVTARWEAEEGLKAASRQKDEFLAMLAHELRNPLASISNVSELLKYVCGSEPQAQRGLVILQRQISHLTHLVDDLLDVSRIARGCINLKKEAIEIGTVIDQAVETLQPMVQEKSHRLNIRKPLSAVYVSGDSARLVQSLGNILHNAAKYTDAGGEIDVDVQELKGDLRITVRDNGTGIAPELLPNVFDLFVQSPRTLDRSEGGLGIGLTIVKRLIQMHGGRVSAESAGPGCGSTFTIHLPTVPAPGVSEPKDMHYTAGGCSSMPDGGTRRS
jgi:PAS domain S-box-containing protein